MSFLLFLLLASGFDSLLHEGVAALESKRFTDARTSLEAAQKLNSDSPQLWFALTQTYSGLGENRRALEAAGKVKGLASREPGILHQLALFQARNGDLMGAARCEEQYAKYNPDAIRPAILLYVKAGDASRAVAFGEEAAGRINNAAVYAALGQAYEASGNTAKAIPALRKSIQLDPYAEEYYFDLAQIQLLHQDFDGAIRTLQPSQRIFAKSAQLELALGVAYYGLRRFDDAVDSFLRVIAIDPEVEQPYTFLGRIIDHAGLRLPEIEARFEAYSKATPKNAVSQFLYAKAINAASGDPAAAEALLRKSIAMDSRNWESHLELGIALEKRRSYEDAAKELARSIELNSKSSTPHYRLARVYDRLGRKQEAAAERARHAALLAGEEAVAGKQAAGMLRVQ
ncbi:MAG: tetratricopeptide repeat protein [Bryobacteraceae bacterium]